MNYIKGQQVFLKVSEVSARMVGDIHKSYVGKEGIRYIFDVIFENSFTAEYPSPTETQNIFVPGRQIEFKVIGQNQHGTTIEPLIKDHTLPVNTNNINMSGHPAVFALGFAKDLAPHNDWDLQDTFDNAEKILVWLKDHR